MAIEPCLTKHLPFFKYPLSSQQLFDFVSWSRLQVEHSWVGDNAVPDHASNFIPSPYIWPHKMRHFTFAWINSICHFYAHVCNWSVSRDFDSFHCPHCHQLLCYPINPSIYLSHVTMVYHKEEVPWSYKPPVSITPFHHYHLSSKSPVPH